MNELYFRVENTTWCSETPSALYFDELMDALEKTVGPDIRESFLNNVLIPLDKICNDKYVKIAKPDSEMNDRDFSLYLPNDMLKTAIPILEIYIEKSLDGKFVETAKDIIKAYKKAEALKSIVFIWGE